MLLPNLAHPGLSHDVAFNLQQFTDKHVQKGSLSNKPGGQLLEGSEYALGNSI
jgi:hypothetical protein